VLEIMNSTSMSYIDKKGIKQFVDINSDFKVLYFLLVKRYKRYHDIGAEFQVSWDTILHQIGRKYKGDKNSHKLINLLEESGLLIQKSANKGNTTVKILKGYVEAGVQFNNVDHTYYNSENNIFNYNF